MEGGTHSGIDAPGSVPAAEVPVVGGLGAAKVESFKTGADTKDTAANPRSVTCPPKGSTRHPFC
jgi:hypothetical protein